MTDAVTEVVEVKPLSAIFGEKPAPAAKPEPVKVDETKTAEVKPADAGTGDKTGETPAPKTEDGKTDTTKAAPAKDDDPIKAMRKGLTRVQRENAELKRRLEEQTAKPPTPDPIADAEGFTKHIDQTVSDRLWQERLADAHEDLSDQLGDAYEETLEAFQEMMREDPPLYKAWRNSRNPGKFLMKAVEDHRKHEEIGDPQKFAERIRAETRKELEADIQKRIDEGIKKALGQRLPQSLADEQTQGSSRSDDEPAEFRRKPLESILNKRK